MAQDISSWSPRRLADFIADNSGGDSSPGVLTLGPYEVPRYLGILCTEPMRLSKRIVKRSTTSTQAYTLTYRKNGAPIEQTAVINLKANDLFEVGLSLDSGGSVDGRIYVSFEVT